MFPMTITLTNQEQLEAVLALFGREEKKAKEPHRAVEKPSPAQAAQSAASHASTVVAPVAAASTSIDFDTLKTTFLKLAGSNRPAAEAVLKQFGVAKLTQLKEEQYSAAYEATLEALG